MRRVIVAVLLTAVCLTASTVRSASDGLLGKKAPSFKIVSGDGKELTLDKVKGKIVVIFYETREVVEKNRELKRSLGTFFRQQATGTPDLLVSVSVIDCSSAFWPLTRIWKSKLVENSKRERVTIYGDWDGRMRADYNMKENDSNIVVLDTAGTVRYFKSGKVDAAGIDEIEDLLKGLIPEPESAGGTADEKR